MKDACIKLFFLIAVLFHCSCRETPHEEKSETSNTTPPVQPSADTSIRKPQRTPPKYSIVRTSSSYADYEVLIDPVDLDDTRYKQDVEAIIDDIAYNQKKRFFTAVVYDDAKVAEMNYMRREQGVELEPKESNMVYKHIVAQYTKDFDGVRRISYFEHVPADEKHEHKAWKEAFNQEEFSRGYSPK